MQRYTEFTGDLWTLPVQYWCITTNGFIGKNKAVMGRGVALQAAQRYPRLPFLLNEKMKFLGNKVFIFHDLKIITVPVKPALTHDGRPGWQAKADLDLIHDSLMELVTRRVPDPWAPASIALPRPGCGAGQLSWEDVKPLCDLLLDERFIVVNFEGP